MGDPRKARKTYQGPRHPWQKSRIEEEKVLLRDYGLKNKKEVYKCNTVVKTIINHYKKQNTLLTDHSNKEIQELLAKAKRYGFVSAEATANELLNLSVRNILERRLQTIVVKLKLARTPKQARQFIVHRHILINGKVVDSPGYMVPLNEEHTISFVARSNLSDEMHPERHVQKKAEEKPKEKQKEDLETIETAEDVTPVEISDDDDSNDKADESKTEKKEVEAQ